MDYDLSITLNGVDMGTTPVNYAAGQYTLCDACYDLANAVGCDGHCAAMARIMAMLPTSHIGAFDGIAFTITESATL